jgi:hypothetical protein
MLAPVFQENLFIALAPCGVDDALGRDHLL